MRGARFTIVSVLGMLSALSPASALIGTGGHTVVLAGDQVLTEDIYADTIIVQVSCCRYSANITLHATRQIQINGAFVSHPPGVPRALTLASDGDITILGGVYAADAPDAPLTTATGAAVGVDAAQGGSITLRWGPTGAFTLANGAAVRTGAGGDGGDVIVASAGPSTGPLAVKGGRGGNGGTLRLDGIVQYIWGDLGVGAGGRGGSVDLTDAPAAAATPWRLQGGAGGDARLEAMSTVLPMAFTLSSHMRLIGVEGGAGGAAYSRLCADVHALGGSGGSGWTGGIGGDARAGDYRCRAASGAAGTTGCPGIAGADGTSAGPSLAVGGAGGRGVTLGGRGGNATAYGNGGGDGGVGGAGAPGCTGGRGGDGGDSGRAEAVGGQGGCASFGFGGFGGSASAGAGPPGSGGAGGSGDPAGAAGRAGEVGPISAIIGADADRC